MAAGVSELAAFAGAIGRKRVGQPGAQRLLKRYLGRQRLGDPAHDEDASCHKLVLLIDQYVTEPVYRVADVELDVRDVTLCVWFWQDSLHRAQVRSG